MFGYGHGVDEDPPPKPPRSPELLAFMVAMGERLQQARMAKRISLEEAGKRIGKKRAAVNHWEKGVNPVNIADLWMLASMYGTTLQDIIIGEPSDADLARALGTLQSRLAAKSQSIAATAADSGKPPMRARA